MSYKMNVADIMQCYDDGLTTSGQCANQLVEEVMTGASDNLRIYKVTCAYLSKTLTAKEYISHFVGGII